MSVGAVGKFCASVDGGFSLADFRARLERHGVSGNARIDQLSRGQQTQVQLAVAMANRPQLLILDDPTLGLDAVARKEVFAELIDELAERELTVLVATHDLAGIERLATHVGFLRRGQLTLSEPLDGLKRRLRRVSMPVGAVQDVGSSRTVRCRRTALGLERIVEVDEADPAASAAGEPMTLEEIFVALTDEPTGDEECGPGAGAVAARSVVGSTRAGSAA